MDWLICWLNPNDILSLVTSACFVLCVVQPDYAAQSEACNVARSYRDIEDSWNSVQSIIKFFGDDDGNFSKVAKPGYFNDPDMVRLYAEWFFKHFCDATFD